MAIQNSLPFVAFCLFATFPKSYSAIDLHKLVSYEVFSSVPLAFNISSVCRIFYVLFPRKRSPALYVTQFLKKTEFSINEFGFLFRILFSGTAVAGL